MTLEQSTDDNKVPIIIKTNRFFAMPIMRSRWGEEHPSMIVSRKHQSIWDRTEDPFQVLLIIGRSTEIPQILQYGRIQPGLVVHEVAITKVESGLQRAHEVEDGIAVSSARLVIDFPAEPIIMIPPDADRLGIGQQLACFFDLLAGFEKVTDYNYLIDILRAKVRKCAIERFDVFVDVGDDAKLHRSDS
jgi:hypothetical protein